VSFWLRKLPHHTRAHGASTAVACGSVNDAAAVVAGGAIGTLARAGLAEALPVHPGAWPWATFAANIAGSLLLGWVVVAKQDWRPLVGTGFCGALTTFSTFQVQLVELGDDGHVALAAAYLAVSVAVGLLAATAGARLARR
jgi:fluoride exporter